MKIYTYRENQLSLLYHFICIFGEQRILIVVMEEIKYKITTQFKILESSESDSTKIVARSKDSEVQKHRSYIDQLLDTTQGMKYEVQQMMIDSSVEDEMVHK